MKTDKVVYRTKTREEYDWLMQELEKEGCKWSSGKNQPSAICLSHLPQEPTFLRAIKNSHVELVRAIDYFMKVISLSKYQT